MVVSSFNNWNLLRAGFSGFYPLTSGTLDSDIFDGFFGTGISQNVRW